MKSLNGLGADEHGGRVGWQRSSRLGGLTLDPNEAPAASVGPQVCVGYCLAAEFLGRTLSETGSLSEGSQVRASYDIVVTVRDRLEVSGQSSLGIMPMLRSGDADDDKALPLMIFTEHLQRKGQL